MVTNELSAMLNHGWKAARRVVTFVIGGTVVLLGGVSLFTPSPAFVVIPIGLAILATEFVWARRLLRKVRFKAEEFYSGNASNRRAEVGDQASPASPEPTSTTRSCNRH